MGKMNSVVHFEMPSKDQKRVSEFYSKAFGWKMTEFGAEMGNYVLAETTETENGMPKNPGAINGGFWLSEKPDAPHVVISVDNIEEGIKAVEEAGGKIIPDPKMGQIVDIPGIGRYVSFEDTEGNKVGMLQPVPMG